MIAAEREHKAIGQFSDNYPDFDLDTAYRAQRAFVRSKLDAGERFVGYKLGLTSRNKQQAMGVDAPLYGRVTSGMICGYGEPVRLDRFIHPRVESEIAFLLARDIEPPATVVSGVWHSEALRLVDDAQLHTVVGRPAKPAGESPATPTVAAEPPTTATFAEKYGYKKWTTNLGEALEDPEVDVVIIAGPSETHAEMALASLEHGKHTLVEIPIAMNLDGAETPS